MFHYGTLVNGECVSLAPSTRVGDLVYSERSDCFIKVTETKVVDLDQINPVESAAILLSVYCTREKHVWEEST